MSSTVSFPPAKPASGTTRPMDLEIKDTTLIFDSVWADLVSEYGAENLHFPKEIFWLNGAPGAGKGTQTRFIMEYKGITAAPVVVSDLLTSPEAKRLKDAGLMVGDREVTGLLLRRLLTPDNRNGVVVDGFPRTKVQVECLKLFYHKLMELRNHFLNTPHELHFLKPIFHIVVLYVDEQVSINRQLDRGRQARASQQNPSFTGKSNAEEVRPTDLSQEAARNRYRTFKEITYEALASLRDVFHYHFINAQDSIEKVQEYILDELKYQSSLELDQTTNDLISHIPIASTIVMHARQELVKRLDSYAIHSLPLFRRVIELVEKKFFPIVLRHAISGMAMINSEDDVFQDPLALAMLIDVFSERGYHAVVDIRRQEVPDRLDPQTWKIHTRTKKVFRFRISFQGSVIRRGR
ncbi:MAG: nucleoside monophosphate kinase [Verrucomicrobiota bacterium]|nr:nucleoside monophosphate kinase [Verrucomicrobiota bacterium]